VARELWRLGVAPEKIETVAMGATNFVASNKTPAGKAENRRVEIVVTEP
jgi:outer membrane protein OmpA-like peptidoglycan-associated protein